MAISTTEEDRNTTDFKIYSTVNSFNVTMNIGTSRWKNLKEPPIFILVVNQGVFFTRGKEGVAGKVTTATAGSSYRRSPYLPFFRP